MDAHPGSYTELVLQDVRGLIWEDVIPLPRPARPKPTERDLEILAGLWSYRLLSAGQIRRRWWRDNARRSAQEGMQKMVRAGWVRRLKFQLGEPGAQQRLYLITRDGFELLREQQGPHGQYLDSGASWREPRVRDPQRALRELRVNGWVLGFEQLAGRTMTREPVLRQVRFEPPRRDVGDRSVELRSRDVALRPGESLRDSALDRFEPVSPDAIIGLGAPVGPSGRQLDLIVELDDGLSPGATEQWLRRYDGFLSAWWRLLTRYQTRNATPAVVVVCRDEDSCRALLRIADRVLTTRIAKVGAPESDTRFPARRWMLFAAEAEIHHGSLRAFAVPPHPPDLRLRREGPRGGSWRPRRVQILDPRLL